MFEFGLFLLMYFLRIKCQDSVHTKLFEEKVFSTVCIKEQGDEQYKINNMGFQTSMCA